MTEDTSPRESSATAGMDTWLSGLINEFASLLKLL